ncbi:MAG: hypothetical protein ACXQTS_01625 [Candidatus Methanospirareceae archaeon]
MGDTYFEVKGFKEFQGTVGYTVDLGNPKDLKELSETIETVKEAVSAIEVEAGHQIIIKAL